MAKSTMLIALNTWSNGVPVRSDGAGGGDTVTLGVAATTETIHAAILITGGFGIGAGVTLDVGEIHINSYVYSVSDSIVLPSDSEILSGIFYGIDIFGIGNDGLSAGNVVLPEQDKVDNSTVYGPNNIVQGTLDTVAIYDFGHADGYSAGFGDGYSSGQIDQIALDDATVASNVAFIMGGVTFLNQTGTIDPNCVTNLYSGNLSVHYIVNAESGSLAGGLLSQDVIANIGTGVDVNGNISPDRVTVPSGGNLALEDILNSGTGVAAGGTASVGQGIGGSEILGMV